MIAKAANKTIIYAKIMKDSAHIVWVDHEILCTVLLELMTILKMSQEQISETLINNLHDPKILRKSTII